MVRKLPALLAALLAAIGAGALAVTLSSGSSHREAPLSRRSIPTADDTDVYAFTARRRPDALTIVANWIPFEDPGRRPELLPVRRPRGATTSTSTTPATAATTSATGSSSRRRSATRTRSSTRCPACASIDDPKLNVQQTYDVTRETYRNGTRLVARRCVARDLPVAPNNVGPKTFPNYDAVAAQAIRHAAAAAARCSPARSTTRSSSTSATTFDAINIRKGTGNAGGGKDDLAGYNVHSIVLQVPKAEVTRDGKPVARRRGARTPSSACGRHDRSASPVRARGVGPSTSDASRTGAPRAGRRRGPGQPPRQPAGQRGRDPAREEGLLQRDAAGRRPEELRQVRRLAGAREGHQRPVPGPERPGDEPDGHRPGAADRASRA